MYKYLNKCFKKRHVYILIILQKVCQNVKSLEMKEKTILGGIRFCANPHVLRAKPHSQHNANVKI